MHDLADAEDLKSLYDRFVMLVYLVFEKFVSRKNNFKKDPVG